MGRSLELSDFEHGLVIGCHSSKISVRDSLLNEMEAAVDVFEEV
jgi:hypothetical protein